MLVRGLETERWWTRRGDAARPSDDEADPTVLRELADEELFERFRRGERAAFEVLLRRHRAPLFTFVLRTLGTGDRARAEDVVQDAFVRVLKGAAEWQQKAKFQTWLYTIARNLCLDAMRRDKHRKAESLDAEVGGESGDEGGRPLGELVEGSHAGPERLAEAGRLRPALEQALAKLPVEQREVFVLREYAGVPFKEIAEQTGVSENTVKSRMRYALESMRRTLAALGIEGDLADDDAARPRATTVAG